MAEATGIGQFVRQLQRARRANAGYARAHALTKRQLSEIGRRGGRASMARLTPDQRHAKAVNAVRVLNSRYAHRKSEWGRLGMAKRWGKRADQA